MMAKITVLMTTYNEKISVLEQAIESIRKQTFSDFNFLIIADNPGNKEIINCLERYRNIDSRIKYLINENNMGLPLSLNRGIECIETKYIARMDADDIAFLNRLEVQYQYLEAHQEVDLIGTNMVYIDEDSNVKYARGKIITNQKYIPTAMKYINFISHPTFMGKTEIFKKYKYRNLRYSQDYDFSCRLLENGCVLGNIQEPLLYYRQIETISDEKRIQQRMTYHSVQRCYRKGNLTDSDITAIVEKEILSLDFQKELVADKKYTEAFKNLSKKNALKFVAQILDCAVMSKYQRKQLLNLILYALIRTFV